MKNSFSETKSVGYCIKQANLFLTFLVAINCWEPTIKTKYVGKLGTLLCTCNCGLQGPNVVYKKDQWTVLYKYQKPKVYKDQNLIMVSNDRKPKVYKDQWSTRTKKPQNGLQGPNNGGLQKTNYLTWINFRVDKISRFESGNSRKLIHAKEI